jgi:phosphomevalonate kinase
MRASAPGKLVLFGEYAVLEGAPALVAAIDRRATVELTRPASAWSVGGRPLGGPGLEVVEAVLGLAHDAAPAEIRIDTAAFVGPAGGKLGFGSSAAVAVALYGALRGATAQLEAAFAAIEPAHRRAQGGVGSGVDVAASLWGGVLSYRRGKAPERVSLPAGVRLLAIDSGKSARTSDLVAAVARAAPVREMARLADLAERGRSVLDDTAALFDLVEQFHEAMAALGRAAGVPIVSDEHAAIERAVRRAGGAYKPSGAGGGDVGVAFVDSEDAAQAVREAVTAAGFRALGISVDPAGLEIGSRRV